MSKEKQIEEMAQFMIGDCGVPCHECKYEHLDGAICIPMITAEHLYNAGYRKQSEGEWHYNPDGMDWGLGAWECSLCGCGNNNLPMDENIKPLRWAGSKCCPNCGARMKGGAE